MFWKKKRKEAESKFILGMIMLEDDTPPRLGNFIADYAENYGIELDELYGDDSAATFSIDGITVIIGHIGMPIPSGDIEGTVDYAYNWPSAAEDVKGHRSHLIVTIIDGKKSQVDKYKIFTRVVSSLLRTTPALGVYQGSQTLLIRKQDYLEQSALMADDFLPVDLWIYVGLREEDGRAAGYTYGLAEFNKHELEVLDSARDIEDIRELLLNVALHVLRSDIVFQTGETLGLDENEKIELTLSEGHFVDSQSFKLSY